MPITVAALRETAAGERRVAITPEMAKKFHGKGLQVLLEHDAGRAAGFPDAAYPDAAFADAAAIAATPPSRSVTRFSRTATVGVDMRL